MKKIRSKDVNVGDKVLVEALVLGENWENEVLCTIGGINHYISKNEIREIQDKTYEDGLREAWETAKKLVCCELTGGMSLSQIEEVFGTRDYDDILRGYTPQEVAEKIAEWEKQELHVGDILRDQQIDKEVIVSCIGDAENIYVIYPDGSCGVYDKNDFVKTGRTVDIVGLLAQIGETNAETDKIT